MTSTDATTRLRQAAQKLRRHLAAIATESPADLSLHADGRTVTQGRSGLYDFATAETPEVAAFIAAMGPLVGEPLATWLETAAANAAALTWPNDFIERALAVADAILGEVTR